MIRWFISVGLRARIAMLVAAAVTILVGAVQVRSSTVDTFPEFDPPLVEVQTEALGLSAAQVESLITVPLEADLLNGVAWLADIRSESIAGLSSIVMEFEPGTDPIRARQMVQERLTQAHALPNVSKPPVMLQPLSSNSRVLMVGLSSDDLSLVDLGVLARWNIKPRLLGIGGVANVAVWGGRDRQLQVLVDPTTLNDAGVTLDEVIETTGEAMWVSPLTFLESSKPGTGGWIDTPNQRLGIRHLLPISSADDLGKVAVVNHEDLVIADIADVTEDHQPLIGDAIVDGDPGLILVIERYPGADPEAVTDDVEATLANMRAGLPGVDIDTDVFRPADYVESMGANLSTAIGLGLILALLVLGLFTWSWRTAVIGLVVILTSITAAALLLEWRGASLNLMTIGGLLIALAVVVDEAVVDTDTLARRWREARDAGETGSSRTAVFFSALEARRVMLPAGLVLILVILPVFFLEGIRGDLFSPLAEAYVIAIAGSFVVATLLTPALALLLVGNMDRAPAHSPFRRPLTSVHDAVVGAAGRLGRTASLAIAGVMAVSGVATLVLMDGALTPTFQQDTALVRWDAAPGTSPTAMLDTIGTVSRDLTALAGVESVSAHVGRAETGDLVVTASSAQLWVRFADGADRAATVEAVERIAGDLPGSVDVAQTFIPERLDVALNGPSTDITVRVFGVDLTEIDAKATEIAELVDVVDGVSATAVDERVVEPQIEVTVDLAAAERYGVVPGDVRRQATTLVSGLQVGSLFEEQKVFDVVVWAEPRLRDDPADFGSLPIDLPDGSQVALAELASIETVDTPVTIRRNSVSRYADVDVTVDGRGVDAVADDIREALREVSFPQEYRAEVLARPTDSSSGRPNLLLMIAVVVAIYLLIQATFSGWRLSLGIMASTLVALSGASLGAAVVTGGDITLPVLFGLLAVLGVAIRHAFLVVDRAQRMEMDAADVDGSVRRAVHERFPAMLTTQLMVIVALVPALVMGNRPGLELLRPMAIVILFGLITTMLSTTIVVPALYDRLRSTGVADDPIDLRVTEHGLEPAPTGGAWRGGSNGDGDGDGDEAASVAGGAGREA